MSDQREHLTDAQRVLALMEDHVRNNEMKLLRLHMGMEKVVDASERTEAKLSEMVDDVATLRTRVAHIRDDVDEIQKTRIGRGTVYMIAGTVVGAALTVAAFAISLFK
jgi:septal ring factor EnvC (AmiA/AmiB activator)